MRLGYDETAPIKRPAHHRVRKRAAEHASLIAHPPPFPPPPLDVLEGSLTRNLRAVSPETMLDRAPPDLRARDFAEAERIPQLIQEHGTPWSISAWVGGGIDRVATLARHRRMISSRCC